MFLVLLFYDNIFLSFFLFRQAYCFVLSQLKKIFKATRKSFFHN